MQSAVSWKTLKKNMQNLAQNGFLLVRRTVFKMTEPYFEGAAAELAFFFLLSLVPTMILLAQLLGLFSLSLDALRTILEAYLSEEMAAAISPLVSYRPSGAISVAFILLALWAASKAQFSLMRISNYAFTGLSRGRGYIRERVRAVKTIVIVLMTLVFALNILVYGEIIVDVVAAYLTDFLGMRFELDRFWFRIRWPIAMLMYFFMVSWTYYVLPTVRPTFRSILPGSVFASAGMLTVTGVYSYYTQVFANYDLLYGSLATIVMLLVWFYILSYVLIIGISLNAVLNEMANEEEAMPDWETKGD